MIDPLERIAAVFDKAPFIRLLGMELVDAGDGWVETALDLRPELLQQHGFAHAGVVGTLADHTAGGAASTVIPTGHSVLTADYTLHLLRPATGPRLRCRGEVVRSGRTLVVAESNVWSGDLHAARYVATLAVVEREL